MRRGETRWCDAAEYDRGAVIERYVVRARVCVSGSVCARGRSGAGFRERARGRGIRRGVGLTARRRFALFGVFFIIRSYVYARETCDV